MGNKIPLTNLQQGQRGYIDSLTVSGALRRRLQDIGLIEGTLVECLQKSPAGDPVAYQIRGAVIALRNNDSKNIWIKEVN